MILIRKKYKYISVGLWIISLVICIAGVFVIPWHVDIPNPITGESYVFGFNNRVATFALGVSILVGFIASLIYPKTYRLGNIFKEENLLLPKFSKEKLNYFIIVLWSIISTIAIIGWGYYLVDPAWNEARYFQNAIDQIAIGKIPYRDFLFNYGPLTIYPPYILSRISCGHISFESSYAVFLSLYQVIGYLLIFIFLNKISIRGPFLTIALILNLLLWAWSIPHWGMQGSPIRSLSLPISLLILDHFVCKENSAEKLSLRVFLFSLLSTFIPFSISPEMGVATCISIIGYSVILVKNRAVYLAFSCLFGSFLALMAIVYVEPKYLFSIINFSRGCGDIPIFPTPMNFSFVGMAILIIPLLLASSLKEGAGKLSPLAFSMGIGAGIMVAAACARCDFGHIIQNSIILTVVMFAYISHHSSFVKRLWIILYIIVFLLVSQLAYWNIVGPYILSAIAQHKIYSENPKIIEQWKNDWDKIIKTSTNGKYMSWSKTVPYPKELEAIVSQGSTLLAYGNTQNLGVARFLLLQNDLPNDYFSAFSDGPKSEDAMQQKMQASGKATFLIVPKYLFFQNADLIDLQVYQKQMDNFLSRLLIFPVSSKIIRPPFIPETHYAQWVLQNFKLVGEYQEYVIFKNNKL